MRQKVKECDSREGLGSGGEGVGDGSGDGGAGAGGDGGGFEPFALTQISLWRWKGEVGASYCAT